MTYAKFLLQIMNSNKPGFIRFGRIFSGVGFVQVGAAFIKWKLMSVWLGWSITIMGLAAICIILFIPVNFEIYKPMFHIKALWLVAMGVMLLKQGVHLPVENG